LCAKIPELQVILIFMSTSRSSVTNPGLSATNIVIQCLTRQKDLQEALDLGLHSVPLQRDKALITEIVYGYLRFKGRIDFVMNLFLDNPGKLPPGLKILLGLAGYELFFLDRVPDYAAVSRAVDSTGYLFGRKMSKLTNAVLRKARQVDIFSESTFKKDSPGEAVFWSRYYSCPLWIVKMWKKTYGRESCHQYLRQSLDRPPLGLRAGKEFLDLVSGSPLLVQRIKNSLLVSDMTPGIDKCLREKMVFRQSFAGQQAMFELGMMDWAQPVWDMCAGSGGKTFLMLDLGMDVYSSDVSLKRLKNLKPNSKAYGSAARVFAASGHQPPFKTPPGTILIDAPCTGLGVLSRRPDIKWKRRPLDIERLTKTQAGLLGSAARISGKQGRIVYLTCTLNKDENERRVNDFLYEHKNFELEKMFQTDIRQELKESFFGAVFKKTDQRSEKKR
jgi:16S rRNA (cytosine967-C5)-methyltransferase